MKTLKISTLVTLVSLLCMGMGFPNIALDDEEGITKMKRSQRTRSARTVAMACTRQVKVTQQSLPENAQPCLTTREDCKKDA